jgi:hypothetical protein
MKRSNTFLITLLALLTSIFIFTNSSFAQLVGGNTYPVNGVENPPTSFNNITSAVAYLTTNGVTGSGEVILELSSGYPGELAPVTIPVITGSSSTLGVTFRPALGTIITTSIPGAASPNQFAIKVTGNYITLDGRAGGVGTNKDWTIACTGGGTSGLGQMAIKVDNTTNSMTGLNFRYLNLIGEAASTTGAVFQITGVTTNTISNVTLENCYITSTADTSIRTRGYGITLAVASNVGNTGIIVRNNEITDFFARGINHTGGFPGILIYGNNIYHTKAITQPTTTEFSGIYNSTTASAGAKLYDNYIHDIQLTNGTTAANGIYFFNGNSSGNPMEAYNNRVQIGNGITATTFPIYGIRDNALSGSLINFYYNSVLVDGIATAGTSNSAAFRKDASNSLNIKDNIFYNTRTNTAGTGTHWAISVNNTTFLSINNNDYFADGTGGVLGTTTNAVGGNQTTLAGWKSAVVSDVSSVSQNPHYVAGLKIDTAIQTQLEGGGSAIATITTDFEGDTRNASTPDIGADEFIGIPLDLVPPTITYTNIVNTSNITDVSLTANITDISGIDTGANSPRFYLKKGTAGTFVFDAAPVVTGDDYSFNINYTAVGGVLPGDTIFYYVAAQDLNANVGTNPSGGSGSNPPGIVPPANLNYFRIVDSPLNGSYTVGLALFNKLTGKNVSFEKSVEYVNVEVPIEENSDDKQLISENESTSLQPGKGTKTIQVEKVNWVAVESGKLYSGPLYLKKNENPQVDFPAGVEGVYATITAAVSDLNLRGVNGATTFLLVDNTYTSETLPITINIANANVTTSTNTLTIKPNTSVTASITGASASAQVFKILNSYVTIDGSNNGTSTRDLTITNSSATSPQVLLIGSIGTSTRTDVTIKNTNLINGINSSSALIVSDGTTSGTAGYFKNISLENNTVQNAYIGVYCNAVVSSGNGRGLSILNNQLDLTGASAIRYVGLYLQGVDSALVSGNSIGNFVGTNSEDDRGIWLATSTRNTVISNNNIYSLKYTGTSGYGAYGIAASTGTIGANIVIVNNLVSDISGDGWNYTTVLGDNTHGLYLFSTQSGIYVYYNSINLEGSTLNQTNALSSGICIGTGTTADLKNNIINNNLGLSAATGFGSAGIFLQTASTQLNYSNYNDIYVNPTGTGVKYLGQIAAVGYNDLASWQTASGKDSNSISAAPQFNTLTDLKPLWTSPVLAAGNPVAGITLDFEGTARSLTNPSIGAYETGLILPMNGTYTVGLAAFNQAYGKDVYFEKITQSITKDLDAIDSHIDRSAFDYSEKYEDVRLPKPDRFIEVVEEKIVLMENGKPFDQNFFRGEQTLGIYPTLTSAVSDLTLRGVNGPVTLELVDALYPNETYPILIPTITGADSVNTITIKPAAGVVAEIPGSVTQASSTIQLGGGSFVIIDGSNNGSASQDLTISAQTTTAPALHFFSGGNNNVIKNVIVQSKNTSTGSGSLIFAAGTGSMNNLIDNCTFKRVDTSATRFGVGVYFFSSTLSSFNQLKNSKIIDFANYGVRPQGAAGITNNSFVGNEIYQVNPSVATSIYGIYLSRGPETLIQDNYIHDLKSTGTTATLTGIIYLGASGVAMNAKIINNVVSVGADYIQASGILRGIDYYGFAANSVEIYFNSVFINGSDVTGTSITTGFSKRDAALTFIAKNNTIFNNRSNGTGTGKHYGIYASNTVVTTPMVDYNNYYVAGTGGVFGYWGTADIPDLTTWVTTTGLDSNSISANPQYVSLTDLRPQLTSPLLGSGVSLPQVTVDFLGVTRGNPPTIGAFEEGVATTLTAPTNLTAIADTFAVVLNWDDNSVAELGFYIERKNGDTLSVDPYVVIDTVGVDVVSYFDGGRTPNTTYTYRVQAYNSLGVSAYSNEVTTTTIVPVELTSFVANVGENQISISWSTATELNNSGFDLERKLDGEWKKVTFIQGKGTTTEQQEYSYNDQFKYQSFKGTAQYRLKQIDFDGTYSYSKVVSVEIDFTPKEYTLYQNYPNPFNPSTTIKFALPFNSQVRIVVYNLLGEQVDVILDQVKEVGYHNVNFNASTLASGVYIYTIDAKSVDGAKNYSSVKKMMLVK